MKNDFDVALDDDDQVVSMTPNMVVFLAFDWAYHPAPDEGPEPVKRAHAVIDAGLVLAEQRGFKHSARLRRAFSHDENGAQRITYLERLFKVVSAEEFLSASGVFSALFETLH